MHGLVPDTVRVASADASFRRYFRVDRVGGAGSCIIMDAPPAQENCAPFVHVGRLMEAAGLKVPRDVAVVGFDDIPVAALTNPPLTTVAQDTKRAGELLVETLIHRIRNEPTSSVMLPARVVVRRSCGAPAQG